MIALLWFFLTLLASPFKSKSRLEAENAALRHQLIVLQRRVSGRVQLTNGDRLFLVMLYRHAVEPGGGARVECNPNVGRRSNPWWPPKQPQHQRPLNTCSKIPTCRWSASGRFSSLSFQWRCGSHRCRWNRSQNMEFRFSVSCAWLCLSVQRLIQFTVSL